MKFAFVLEDDPKFEKEIVESLNRINPNLQIRTFNSLDQFATWIKELMVTGKQALKIAGKIPAYVQFPPVPAGESDDLSILVAKTEFLGVGEMNLLKKTKDLFTAKGLNPEGSSTAFVLTGFEGPQLQPKKLEEAIITNLIYKPFDRLILREMLAYALEGHVAPSKDHEIAQQKTKTQVEMLKDVSLEGLGDIGFITKTDRPIPIGAIAKYYGSAWTANENTSAFAICANQIPHPVEVGHYQTTFNFFGIMQDQLSALRKRVRAPKETQLAWKWQFPDCPNDATHNFVVVDEEEHAPGGLVEYLRTSYVGAHVIHYAHFATFQMEFDPSKAIQQRDASIRAIPATAPEVEMHFDATTKFLMAIEPKKDEVAKYFGTTEAELKRMGAWFNIGIPEEQREHFLKILVKGEISKDWDQVFSVTSKGEQYFIKVLTVVKQGNLAKLKIRELTKDEMVNFLRNHSHIPKKVHGLFISSKYTEKNAVERWAPVVEQLKVTGQFQPRTVVINKSKLTDNDKRNLATFATDILEKPIDRAYLNQKIAVWFKGMKKKGESIQVTAINSTEIVKVSNPVQLLEVSEAGLVVDYDRDTGLNTYREFVLWQPYRVGDPELRAKVNFVEEAEAQEKKGPPRFRIQFIFFGVTDLFLKKSRVWIRDIYIHSKDKS